jgi:hypothetical protein
MNELHTRFTDVQDVQGGWEQSFWTATVNSSLVNLQWTYFLRIHVMIIHNPWEKEYLWLGLLQEYDPVITALSRKSLSIALKHRQLRMMNWGGCEKKQLWVIWRSNPRHYLDQLRKTMKKLSHESQSLDQDFNMELPKYETGQPAIQL